MTSHLSENRDSRLTRYKPLPCLLLLWLGYTALFALYIPEPAGALLSFIPGLLGVALLCKFKLPFPKASHLSSDLSSAPWGATGYLRFAPLSRAGLAVMAGMLLLMIPVILSGLQESGWIGWDWGSVLVFSLASGVSQELFFRSALLPGLLLRYPDRPKLALLLQALLFALFHAGMFTIAPPGAALSAMLVTFLAGLGWGYQVYRDQTVLWAMLHHAFLQVILRGFAWG